jgi:pimeloyl-ACP methyl ester carboxylesterase
MEAGRAIPLVLARPARLLLPWIVLALLGAAGVAALALERGWLEVPLADLTRRYALPESRFVAIDGVNVHYVDSGTGDAVVLLHASYQSLRSWDALAGLLDDRFRVIRLDLSGAGLTGPDPTGQYGIERSMALVIGLLDELGLGQAAVVGTSSGGITAFRLAAAHPERVTRLILINAAGLPRTAATNPLRPPPSGPAGWVQARWRSRGFWEQSLSDNFVPPHRPSPDLVQMTFDLNRRAGWRDITARFLANFRTGDPQAVLMDVRAPTLILWGLENRTLSHLEAEVFAYWLPNATVTIRKYPGLGHYAYLEEPAVVAGDIAAFLAGGGEAAADDAVER